MQRKTIPLSLQHLCLLVLLSLIAFFIARPLIPSLTQALTTHRQHTMGTGQFRVVGNKIIDPNGTQFIVKGVNALFGPWLPLQDGGWAAPQYQYAKRDFAIMKSLGINHIRIWTSTIILDPAHADLKAQLANVINWAEQQELVIQITNGVDSTDGPHSRGIQQSNMLMQYLASTYKDHPSVWLEPLNEPECAESTGTYCTDWNVWHTEWTQFIQTIRTTGFVNPIVVDEPYWSWYLTNIDNPHYALHDSNLIYTAHRYSVNNLDFWGPKNTANIHGIPEPQDCDQAFADYSANHAVIVDEFGPAWIANNPNYTWMGGFLDYLVTWVNKRHGSGVDGFLWAWPDGNSMTVQNIRKYEVGPTLNTWGNQYKTRYLDRVPGS